MTQSRRNVIRQADGCEQQHRADSEKASYQALAPCAPTARGDVRATQASGRVAVFCTATASAPLKPGQRPREVLIGALAEGCEDGIGCRFPLSPHCLDDGPAARCFGARLLHATASLGERGHRSAGSALVSRVLNTALCDSYAVAGSAAIRRQGHRAKARPCDAAVGEAGRISTRGGGFWRGCPFAASSTATGMSLMKTCRRIAQAVRPARPRSPSREGLPLAGERADLAGVVVERILGKSCERASLIGHSR